MTIASFFKLYAVALFTFFVIDLLWLGVVARGFYQKQMGHLMKPNVNWPAAFVFYLVFVTGIVVWRLTVRAGRLQEQHERRRRLAALGEMAAVLSHEIRNPLSTIKGQAQLLADATGTIEEMDFDHLVLAPGSATSGSYSALVSSD